MRRPQKAFMDGRWPAVYETVVQFTCEDGYYLDGPESMQCSDGGQWVPPVPPSCSSKSK